MTLHLYGIPNCETVKQARSWLEAHDVTYDFHDYKREGVDPKRLSAWADRLGWEALLNRGGTTFRKLDPDDREDLDPAKALALMVAHPSLIKRPVVEGEGVLLAGFRPELFEEHLA